MPINRRLVDNLFETVPEDVKPGLIPETHQQVMASSAGALVVDFSDVVKTLTKAKRHELAKKNYPRQRRLVKEIRSQGDSSACVGFGAAKALEMYCTRTFGNKHWHPLSGMGVYNFIGDTYKSGANISAGMSWVANHGAIALDHSANADLKHTWGEMQWSKRKPKDYDQQCVCRVAKYAVAHGADEIETGSAMGLIGIYGRSWHCIPPFGLLIDSGDPLIAYANSWGSDWNDKGIGYDSYRTYRDLYLYFILEVVTPSYISLPSF